ncbi:isoleucine--tRNA ligase [Alphaproteobacteria bacterium]|nr:isoleucine--tRNA ligase [Alphaproteobacteria bacterium]
MEIKDSILLPKTEFSMKADLPKKEPGILESWQNNHLYENLRKESKDKEKFILHDGPPYANGHLHMGHALNKILKDIIVKYQQLLNKNSIYVPGWDCHGLPIEWKIEEQYRAKKKNKDDVPVLEFRKECRDFANNWIDIQKKEFQRLGVIGDWDNPYTTMHFHAEAQIVRELGKFLENGGIYKGHRPVLWSVVEKTALADAEVEYQDHKSTTIYTCFPIINPSNLQLVDHSIVIWTTTPWTIPGNRALAVHEDIIYQSISINHNDTNRKIIIAKDLIENFIKENEITEYTLNFEIKGKELIELNCKHPLFESGYDFTVPVLHGDFVTTEQGTGIVHICPVHGMDDFLLGKQHNLELPMTIDEGGVYYEHIPIFAGKHIFKVDQDVCDEINKCNNLISQGVLIHSYPHSWRSKAPLVYKNTSQWFISMEKNELRKKAIEAIDQTEFFPKQGQNRLRTMIQDRPDWCVSRQRVWGVPLPIFVNKKTGEPLRDNKLIERIASIYEQEGGDAWFNSEPSRFLSPDYDSNDYEQVKDVVEVWFDSGSTHSYVLEAREDLQWPASMYLEGSDQHRGWFHSSLLESCGTRGKAPFESILSHGFVVDGKGRKMSKSIGNVISPDEIINKYGADILRIWVVASDYSEDLKIDNQIINYQIDSYRKIRNTIRFLLGNLNYFSINDSVELDQMPDLEKYILNKISMMNAELKALVNKHDYHGIYVKLLNFCTLDLSAFYFDIRKDSLYCDERNSLKRRSVSTCLHILFDFLSKWFAPIISFTSEEAWQSRHQNNSSSILSQIITEKDFVYSYSSLENTFSELKRVRKSVTAALEIKRNEKLIGSSLQAKAIIYIPSDIQQLLSSLDLAEMCIVSEIEIRNINEKTSSAMNFEEEDIFVDISLAEGDKCQRCWTILPEVKDNQDHLCKRCDNVWKSFQ